MSLAISQTTRDWSNGRGRKRWSEGNRRRTHDCSSDKENTTSTKVDNPGGHASSLRCIAMAFGISYREISSQKKYNSSLMIIKSFTPLPFYNCIVQRSQHRNFSRLNAPPLAPPSLRPQSIAEFLWRYQGHLCFMCLKWVSRGKRLSVIVYAV
jgi:hypothetical protein